ncbi:MAG: hypothetical protein ACI8XO_000565 [Verrucomicrobiales bacterium]|jgi:hypothetical protein
MSMFKRPRTLLAIAAFSLMAFPASAADLTHESRTEVSQNNANFRLSVFPGAASYDDSGLGAYSPPTGTVTTLGDGTVLDYIFVGNSGTGSPLASYSDGGAGRIPTPTSPAANVHGNGEEWADVWTTTNPAGFSSTKNHNPTGVAGAANTFARSAQVDGTIDISGLGSGQIYIPIGSFNNAWSLTLTMSGAGQSNIVAVDSQGSIGNQNRGYISSFDFTNEGQYDQISYNFSHGDTDGSRARFMGVILDGTVAATTPPTVVNSGATGITPTGATIGGEVTENGGGSPAVTLYWGDNDGGTTVGNWDNAILFGGQAGTFSTGISGLTPATTYYFRAFASNAAGDDWANSTATFSTGAPPNPPTVVNNAASGVTFTEADLNGTVTGTGGESPNVTIYFGDNDGGTTPGSWDDSIAIGAQSGAFSNTRIALTHNTTYHFRAFAQNSGGSNWAPSTASFSTQAFSLPIVTNSAATNITGTAAQVGGEVTSTGGDTPTVTIYFGDNDGGTAVGGWDDSVVIGAQSADFSSVLSGLSTLTTHFFRASAQNAAGTVWASSTLSFTTLEVSELIINEFMAANDGGNTSNPNSWYPIANQIPGTSEDWIEILNTGTSTLDLGGWHLTDSAGTLNKWTFPPGTNLSSGQFLIVYASSDNAPDANGNLCTNFKLSAGGDYLALVRPSGIVASAFGPGGSNYPSQSDDVSYGLHPNTSESVFFSSPTPGAANDASGLARVEDTKFSPDRGYYQTAIDVTIATDTPGATIYYTTDGMPPVDTNGTPTGTATAYAGPIALTQTTAVRAAAVQTGFAPTDIDTHTYFLLDIDNANTDGTDTAGLNTPFLQQTRPAGWGNLSSGDFNMDTRVSKATATASGHTTSTAQTMLKGMRDIPTISIAMNRDDFSGGSGIYFNSTQKGFAWERECSAEFIPAAGDTRADWQENCGLRVQGGASRTTGKSPKHSLSFRFRGPGGATGNPSYGVGKLREVMFPGSAVEEFNVIALRAGYNNSWIHSSSGQRTAGSMIRDQWMRESMLDMGNPAAGEGFMAHLFINGLYWGVHNLAERQDAAHYAAHNGGDEKLLDGRNAGSTNDGNTTAYNAMKALIAATGTANYWEKVQGVLEIDQHIDYQIINRYGGNSDLSSGNNWRSAGGGPFPVGQPELMAPWQIYSWDGERSLESQSHSGTPGDPMGVRDTLLGNAEYKIRFADRLQKHFFNGGALTPAATKARWMKYANNLDRAIIAESARWGDHRGTLYTRDNQWLTEQARLCNNYFPVRSNTVFNAYGSTFPNTDAPVFRINATPQHGGEIPGGGTLTITATSGTIYYTLDGSDPRLEGGAISPSAIAISSGSTVTLSGSGLIRMRARSGGEWSALDEAKFYIEPLAGPGDLAITEIHYNPYRADSLEQVAGAALTIPRVFDNPDDFEFIEIQNISGGALNLDGVAITSGINHTFGVQALPAGGHVVLVKDPEAFGVRYSSVTPAGTYSGGLDNAGEQILLETASGSTIALFTYDNSGQWPGRADGNGSSLELISTAGSYVDPANWRSSCEFNGSPTAAGAGPDGRIIINEVLSHTDLPEKDSIELFNTTGSAINISGWILSDDNGVYPSFAISSTTLGAGVYTVFDEDDFNPTPTGTIIAYSGTLAAAPTTLNVSGHGLATGDTISIEGYGGISAYNDTFEVTVTDANNFTIDTPFLDNHSTKGNWISGRPFGLSASRGEDLWLLETDGSGRPIKFVDKVDFAAAFNGETLGRWPDAAGTGTLVSMTSNTLGSVNLGAQVGPVIISEVMYQPDAPAEDNLEFVEICNAGIVTENLANWRLRGGADFDFTVSHSLAPGGLLVVVAFDPIAQPLETAAFRSAYGIDATIPLVGPFTDGPLGNGTGTVRLQHPDTPPAGDPGFYPQVTEDEVIYSSDAPWPPDAEGNGDSLNRAGAELFGNFASSWTAESPTPGGKRLDYQNWSAIYGVGAGSDDDENDGLPNLVEFALGLNPLVSDIDAFPSVVIDGGDLTLTYSKNLLLSGITCLVEYSTDLITWDPASESLVSSSNYTEVVKASVTITPNTRLFMRFAVEN